VSLLGPVTRVSGSAQKGLAQRVISSEPLKGTIIDVDVPTHIAGVLDFASGVTASLITSFDVYSHHLPELEIYGTEGTIQVPDPNFYCGPVLYKRGRAETWSEIPLLSDFSDDSRGLGVVDMAEAIQNGKPHRASGKMAYHVLDLMHGIHDASESGKYYEVKSTCERPAPCT
jgi:predicted dehydrogenase